MAENKQTAATEHPIARGCAIVVVAFFSAVIAVAVAGVLVGVFVNVVRMVMR
jgi:hypothetical protein